MIRQTRSKTKRKCDLQNKEDANTSCASGKRPHSSSSESDIEKYLKPANEIDLDSSFFDDKPTIESEKPFSEIEKNILGGVTSAIHDSDSSDQNDEKEREAAIEIQKINLQRMQEHLEKIDEAKKHVEEYMKRKGRVRKKNRVADLNVSELLSLGEKIAKPIEENACNDSDDGDVSSNDDWEEVKELKEKEIVPKVGVEITVQMPGVIREKKGIDLLAAMKRRLNRIKKENQIFIHKVSLLCWIAHGNFLNKIINNEEFLGLALSFIPSEQCYPADRTDLSYLEQILNWYRKTMQFLDKNKDYDFEQQLHIDINKKQASNKTILVLIFICILRALGIQCRLVMSLLVLPLKPSNSELCSLKNTDQTNKKQKNDKQSTKSKEIVSEPSTSTNKDVSKKPKEEASTSTKKTVSQKSKKESPKKSHNNRSETTIKKVQFKDCMDSPIKPTLSNLKMSLRKKSDSNLKKKPPPQTDGANDSESDVATSKRRKPNLKKLTKQRHKSLPDYKELDSEDEFSPTSPRTPLQTKNQTPKINLNKLKLRSKSASPRKLDVRNDIINLIKNRITEENQKTKQKLVKNRRKLKEESDDDYLPEAIVKKKHDSDDEFVASLKPKVKKRVQVKKDADAEKEGEEEKRRGNDVWIEVFLEAEEKWISVDVIKKQVHCVNEIYVSIITKFQNL